MLNPFLAFCSFMALLYTIKIQTEELRDSRREAKKSADALTGQLDILKVQKFYDIFYRLLSDFQSFSFKDKRRSHSDYSDLMRAYGRFHHKPDFNELMFIRNDICNLNGVSDSVGEICGDIFLFVENADVLEQDKIFCFRRLQLAMSEELSFLIGLYFNKIVVQKSHDGYVDKVISIIKKRKLINNGCFDNSPGGLFFALNTFSGGGILLNQLGYDADDIGVTIVEWSDWVESDNCDQ